MYNKDLDDFFFYNKVRRLAYRNLMYQIENKFFEAVRNKKYEDIADATNPIEYIVYDSFKDLKENGWTDFDEEIEDEIKHIRERIRVNAYYYFELIREWEEDNEL